MKKNIALAVYLNKRNKNSFAALIGALEADRFFDDLAVYFLRGDTTLNREIGVLLKKYRCVVAAFSFASYDAKEIFRLVKRLRPKTGRHLVLLAGGPHPSGDPRGTLTAGFDFVIVGEGEKATADLLKTLGAGRTSFSDIGNLAYQEGREFRFTFKELADLDDYPPFAPRHKIFGPIEITRGCLWGCKYCQTSYLFGRRLRHRSVSRILAYVKILKKSGRKDIRFITPNALSYGSPDGKKVDPKAIERLLKSVRRIVGRGGRIFFGSFPSEVRPEQVSVEALDIIKKYCDNDNLIIGAQSGSQRMLDRLDRGHTVADVYRAVELIAGHGFKAYVDFIFGLPEETDHDRRATLKAVNDLVKMGAIIHAHAFMPLVGTPWAKAEHGKLDRAAKKRLAELEAAGRLFGDWKKQQNFRRSNR